MINDNFLYGAAKLMAGESYTIPSHMAFGSTFGTLTANDISTSGEFDRNALDSLSTTNNIVKFVGRRLSTEASDETIQLVGLHNASGLASTGNLQANVLLSSLIHTTDFDLEVEFWMQFERV
jgi:hypothetical protein